MQGVTYPNEIRLPWFGTYPSSIYVPVNARASDKTDPTIIGACAWGIEQNKRYCNGGASKPRNVSPRNFPWASKFQLNRADPALAQAWHPLRNG